MLYHHLIASLFAKDMYNTRKNVKSPVDTIGRNKAGQVTRSCVCLNHDIFAEGKEYSLVKINAKKIKQSVLSCLNDRRLLLKRRQYLCTACRDYVENIWIQQTPACKKLKFEEVNPHLSDNSDILLSESNTFESTSEKFSQQPADSLVDEVVAAIEGKQFSNKQLCRISAALGKSQSSNIFADGLMFSQDYKNTMFKKKFIPEKWLEERNQVLLSFFNGISEDSCSLKKQTALIKAVEQVYYLRNLNIISPFSFGLNLLCYFVSGSKTAVTLSGASSPSGGYTSLLSALNGLSEKNLNCPIGDVDNFFDNCQVVGKNYHVRLQATAPVSVITSVIHIQHQNSQVQQKVHLSPEHWKWTEPTDELGAFEQQYTDYFRDLRKHFIQCKLDEVTKEQIANINGEFADSIDDDVQPSVTKNTRTFLASIEKGSVLLLENSETKMNLFSFDEIQHNHPVAVPVVKIGEPLLENPNSFQRIENVLDHVSALANVPQERQWLSVGCDGLPYLLACKVIENTFICPQCNDSIKSGPEDFINHLEMHGLPSGSIAQYRKFRNVLLRPGLGHFEINMVKGVFRLLWVVIISYVSRLLGFRSERAQKYCEAASDHHKSWEILQIVFHALSKELLLVFVRSMIQSGEEPTVSKYFNWLQTVKDPNYKFMQEVVFTYLLALNIFRIGVRRNNSKAILAGRQKFCPLFYILGMTKYQEITHRDLTERSKYPEELRQYISCTESVSVSGNAEKGEGGDFILESKNKRMKMWLPKGVPTEKQWVRVNRNLDNLDEIKEALQSQLGFSSPMDSKITISLEKEVKEVRKDIRRKEYLLHPQDERPHVNIEGKHLDHELVHFSKLANENKQKYNQEVSNGMDYRSVKLNKVYVTEEEREKHSKIESKTKSEIEVIITEELLQTLDSIDQRLAEQYQEYFYNTVRKSKKQAYVDFYYEVLASTDEAVALQIAAQDDENDN